MRAASVADTKRRDTVLPRKGSIHYRKAGSLLETEIPGQPSGSKKRMPERVRLP